MGCSLLQRYTEHAQAERLLVFRQLFDAIIERDTKFGPLLSQVKEAYEEWIGLPKQAAARCSGSIVLP